MIGLPSISTGRSDVVEDWSSGSIAQWIEQDPIPRVNPTPYRVKVRLLARDVDGRERRVSALFRTTPKEGSNVRNVRADTRTTVMTSKHDKASLHDCI